MSASSVVIDAVDEVTTDIVETLARLLPQLGSAPLPTRSLLETVVATPGTWLFVARGEEERILGMLTLVTCTTPTGAKAFIEDVVVDELARGQGAGAALVEHALAFARSLGSPWVQLTSRPSREAANRLYQRVGFTQRSTNVWRFDL